MPKKKKTIQASSSVRKTTWRDWGGHPVIVAVGIMLALVGAVASVLQVIKPDSKPMSPIPATGSPVLSTPTQTPKQMPPVASSSPNSGPRQAASPSPIASPSPTAINQAQTHLASCKEFYEKSKTGSEQRAKEYMRLAEWECLQARQLGVKNDLIETVLNHAILKER